MEFSSLFHAITLTSCTSRLAASFPAIIFPYQSSVMVADPIPDHRENGNLRKLKEAKDNRQKANEEESEQRLIDLQEGRDWVVAKHPDIDNLPPVIPITSQVLTRTEFRSTGSGRLFGNPSSNWVNGMRRSREVQPVPVPPPPSPRGIIV